MLTLVASIPLGHTTQDTDMISIASFLTVQEASAFCSKRENRKKNLFIIHEMDCRYHVYDMDA